MRRRKDPTLTFEWTKDHSATGWPFYASGPWTIRQEQKMSLTYNARTGNHVKVYWWVLHYKGQPVDYRKTLRDAKWAAERCESTRREAERRFGPPNSPLTTEAERGTVGA